MKKYLRRMYMKTEDRPFNPFLHLFVLKTFLFGLYFTVLANTTTIEQTNLYKLTLDYLPNNAGNFWGIMLLIVTLGHVLEMQFRGKGFGLYVGILGFMCWLYAAFIYLSTVQWFAFTAFVALDLFFWVWYVFSSQRYRQQLKAETIPPIA